MSRSKLGSVGVYFSFSKRGPNDSLTLNFFNTNIKKHFNAIQTNGGGLLRSIFNLDFETRKFPSPFSKFASFCCF